MKSGQGPISGLLKPGDLPTARGLYLLDAVPDGEPRFGFPNIADNADIVELIACGAHATLFTTGRGSVVGSAIAPVIRSVPIRTRTVGYLRTWTLTPGRILEGHASLDGGRRGDCPDATGR